MIKKRMSIKEIVANKKKDEEKKLKEKLAADRYTKKQYPPLILTMLKRLKRIDPWMGAISFDLEDSILIFYYKLKQRDISPIRIAYNTQHKWVEFNYDDNWWVFDPHAVKKMEYGDPVKLKSNTFEEPYTGLTRYFKDLDSFIETFDYKITISKDEAKILAMKDEGLTSVLNIKYH